jgi:hypothetical protein
MLLKASTCPTAVIMAMREESVENKRDYFYVTMPVDIHLG